MKFLHASFLFVAVAAATGLWAAKDQVMPAKQRQQIVVTAKALFEPEVKNSIKIGRVSSPFAPSAPAAAPVKASSKPAPKAK